MICVSWSCVANIHLQILYVVVILRKSCFHDYEILLRRFEGWRADQCPQTKTLKTVLRVRSWFESTYLRTVLGLQIRIFSALKLTLRVTSLRALLVMLLFTWWEWWEKMHLTSNLLGSTSHSSFICCGRKDQSELVGGLCIFCGPSQLWKFGARFL
jgi:hypothetical protein